MFIVEESAIGKYTQFILSNNLTGESISIVPEYGAKICDLKLLDERGNLHSIIDGDKTEKSLEENKGYKSAVLLPFPNRIRDGLYDFDRDYYQLPINRAKENHAIHGLLYDKPFSVVANSIRKNGITLTLEHVYKGDIRGYPFTFTANLHYSLTHEGFHCKSTLHNTFEGAIPIAQGWHPYFHLNGKLPNCLLKLPPIEIAEIDDRKIPTGNYIPYDTSMPFPLATTKLDTCFRLKAKQGVIPIQLSFPQENLKIEVWQRAGKNQYNYVQVYTPKHGLSIAIEPMTCVVDAFNSGEGLSILQPEETMELYWGVKLISVDPHQL